MPLNYGCVHPILPYNSAIINKRMNPSEELQCIYLTLRRLRFIKKLDTPATQSPSGQETSPTSHATLQGSLQFPRRFLFKLLEDKLVQLNKKATRICNDLFRQIGGKVKHIDKQLLQQVASEGQQNTGKQEDHGVTTWNIDESLIRYPDLDEYFHHCLYYLHDFLIDFDWHESNLNEVEKTDLDYLVDRLPFMNNFIQFQRNLDNLTLREANKTTVVSTKEVITGTNYVVQTVKLLKSAPGTSSKTSSPLRKTLSPSGQKKRVRFVESPSTVSCSSLVASGTDKHQTAVSLDSEVDARLQEALQQDIRDNHSIYASDLLIYSLNLFIQRLSDRLVDWSAQFQANLNDSLKTLLESKQKVRTAQLKSVVKKLKIYNDVHLTVLDYLSEIKQTYLIKCIATILYSRDSERVRTAFKQPRLDVYIQRLSQDVESKLILRLTRQCLRILLDLIVGELNLDPIRGQAKNDENILNFISSWLNLDDVIFGFTGRDRAHSEPTPKRDATSSSLSLSPQFKSSSRILAQMENLSELMRVLTRSIVNRLRNLQQIRYFLESFLCGLDRALDIISPKLSVHSMDLIAAKIRCLKFIYIMGSLEKALFEEALRNKIELDDKKFESKLAKFSVLCMRIPLNETAPKM